MALVRVRSKSKPRFESIVSEEWVARFPDDWDVIADGDVTDAHVPAAAVQAAQASSQPTAGYDAPAGYKP